MVSVEHCDSYINMPSAQTYRLYLNSIKFYKYCSFNLSCFWNILYFLKSVEKFVTLKCSQLQTRACKMLFRLIVCSVYANC
jgi:hypothetical protein